MMGMTFLKRYLVEIISVVLGAVGGFLYWKFIGCLSGTCFIKSVWYMSTIYGALIGYIAGSLITEVISAFRKRRNKLAE
jgi:hypothetical protein